VHALSDIASEAYENAREKVRQFINAGQRHEIIFTSGATGSINAVAFSFGEKYIVPGDEIIISCLEHHANIVPWQMIAEKTGARVIPIPVDTTGTIEMEAFAALLDNRVKMVAVNQVSNALGTINPVADIIKQAHAVGAKVLIDGAQAIAHWPVDVQAMNCDFYVFSGHKLFGPTGIGVLFGRRELLEQMPPYQGGGEMIETVSFSGTTFNQLPYKFEAGTPDIAGAIGLAAAIDYLNTLDRTALAVHEDALLAYATEKALAVPGLKIIGTAKSKAAVLGFVIEGTHPSDIGMLLDQQGIAVRTGHHCAQPLMQQFGTQGTVRASFSFYNTFEEIDRLFVALDKVRQLLL
jgi:cysteine desulfurase/selenocysteine lyase